MSAHSHRHAGRFTILLFAIAFTCELARADEVQVCFNPPLPESCDATRTVVEVLASARHQVLVQAWGLISAPIAQALVEAEWRVQDVRVILDKSAARRGYPGLERAGVLVLIDAEHAMAHSSVIVVDRQTVITGSFNFTRSAQERNAEDLVLIRSPVIATQYARNWNSHAAHSQPVRTEANTTSRYQAAGTETLKAKANTTWQSRQSSEICRSRNHSQAVHATETMVQE